MCSDNTSHQVSTILAEGSRLIVGTLGGLVAIFDSETRHLLSRLNWHQEKVRTLLVLPNQIKPSICAEIGITMETSSPSNTFPPDEKRSSCAGNTTSTSSNGINKQFITSKTTQGPLLASIGNGRRRMNVNNNNYTRQHLQRPRINTRVGEDISLLIWHT